jgi:hypothetical protein
MAVFIDPAEQAAYDNQRRRATDTFQFARSNFAFQRGNVQQNQGIDTNKLARQFDQMRERLPGGYARRGLLNSGIYKRGLTNYGLERQSGFADLAAKYQQMLGQLNMNEFGAGIDYGNTIGDINDQERIRRAQLAAALQGIA